MLLLLWVAGPVPAADVLRIGYLSLAGDPRYVQDWGYARLMRPPPIRTEEAARMAIEDLGVLTEASGIGVSLETANVPAAEAVAAARALRDRGVRLFVADLPHDSFLAVARALEGRGALLLNATAPETDLRTACLPGVLHAGPSQRMLADALMQYLRYMNWPRLLVLHGEEADDALWATALTGAAERLGLVVTENRPFTLSRDPSRRQENNIRLLTSGARYDAVVVADTRGEFGRYIPYATLDPRPVVGSVGLVPLAWHWAMERDGATQVSSRFDRTYGRLMGAEDWSVWIAVKALVTARVKAGTGEPDSLRAFMTSDRFRLDGSKGVTLNFRPWNGQLRMPVLLATSDAVIAVAPLDGFDHQLNRLDTLGADEAEFRCQDGPS